MEGVTSTMIYCKIFVNVKMYPKYDNNKKKSVFSEENMDLLWQQMTPSISELLVCIAYWQT
jgi:hypothetical protein